MVAASQQQPVPRQRLLNKVLWAAIKCFCPLAYSQSMTGERVKRRGKRGKGESQAEPISRLPFLVILNCYRAQLGIGNTFIRICVYYLPCTCSRPPLATPLCVLPAAACWCLAKTIPINLAASKKPLEHTHTQSAPRPFGCLCLAALLSLSTRSLHYWLSLLLCLSFPLSLSLHLNRNQHFVATCFLLLLLLSNFKLPKRKFSAQISLHI